MIVIDTPELRKRIARAILDDLEDRRGIKWELEGVKSRCPDIYAEIEHTLADLVMDVLKQWPYEPRPSPVAYLGPNPWCGDSDCPCCGDGGHGRNCNTCCRRETEEDDE